MANIRGGSPILHNLHIFYKSERKMKNDEFHIPFLHGMIVVAAVTIVSMVFANHFISYRYFPIFKSSSFTSQESQNSTESRE